ncbi:MULTISPECIES: phenylalanine aminomutase (D-beta-phenylalanine forming) [unclassified Mycobacterium]|uniref:phenylalanine aminomutase (D-beta-phenylalanine forming) n=1 Tax=unclassified Mycobacterium TaxID=2642494 RepID=UPI0007FD83FD|nr:MULTISPECIES: phenylalanine aminomutase (D-beta-phenylalanine forming) [unclassified Mycobacterium]OBH07731.1 phenylalanine aminomutase (D-beta-phenylalanine forming) [Mycobacterium sp. E3247]OBI17463.1 phenylalanine aminomutase (D-beta-phenylalanine forming) [Mycobacterium sp. E2497]
MVFTLSLDRRVRLTEIESTAVSAVPVAIDDAVCARVETSRQTLEKFVAEGRVIYGVNTSMGGFVNWLVPVSMARQLQENLLNAVATNVGKHLDDAMVRAIMLSRIVSLARGNSAISLANLEKLIAVLNSGVVPCVPEKGSLGTSGDLGPLAAIALVCIGQWKARLDGEVLPGAEALQRVGIVPMELSFKEGLALINGTSGMVGLGSMSVARARRLLQSYLLVSALSVEALVGKTKPFHPQVHKLKPHKGQQEVARFLWDTLGDSGLAVDELDTEHLLSAEMGDTAKAGSQSIEDAYSVRCTPQILGPVMDSVATIARVVEDELNSSNDNPLIDPDEAEVFHNGHFHGQYVSMAMDHLVIAMTTLINLSNRRIDRYLDAGNSNGLPGFLCRENPGLRLGLMGGQFMTASLTAETRAKAMPISIQSLTSTGDFQDIVSFGFVAARRANEVLENVAHVVAFELLCACQAVDIRGAEGLSTATRRLYEQTRQVVPYLDRDITITDYVEELAQRLVAHPGMG